MERLTNEMQGVFDPDSWIEEGDGLFASARSIRTTWTLYRRKLRRCKTRSALQRDMDWPKLIGMPRASMLLLAYSVEMYLKSGLAKACRGCSEDLFNHLSRREYGHRLYELANEIEFPSSYAHQSDFSVLNKMIIETARYPLMPEQGSNYSALVNARTRAIWDRDNFNKYSKLAKEVRSYVAKLDQDSKNPTFYVGHLIDRTGYFASRIGGGLKPRLTYRYSEEMKQAGKASIEDIRALLQINNMLRVTAFWEKYRFIEDTGPPYKRSKPKATDDKSKAAD